MDTVTISPKFQVVIPKRVREQMDLKPGEKLEVVAFEGRIQMIQVRDIKEMRGCLKGLDSTFERDEEDRV